MQRSRDRPSMYNALKEEEYCRYKTKIIITVLAERLCHYREIYVHYVNCPTV